MKLPFWATALTLAGLIVLCCLGTWQLQRLEWKTDLLTQYDDARQTDPMELELTVENLAGLDPGQLFTRGFVEGIYRHNDEIRVGPRTHEGKPGQHVITPFETLDNQIILINRGWVPLGTERAGFPHSEEPVIVAGTLRRPDERSRFTPPNDPAAGQWHSVAIDEIAAAKNLGPVLPYILYAENEDGPYPVSAAKAWQPQNNHLAYALFWFTMAGALALVYVFRFVLAKKG